MIALMVLVGLTTLPAPDAHAARVPWNQGWSGALSLATVTGSGFADGLESEMNQSGWGKDSPSFTDPFFGFTIPGTSYPLAETPGGSFGARIAHAWNPSLDLALAYASAGLGGATGWDGSRTITVTGAVGSLGLFALFHDAKARLLVGGGPTVDWLAMDPGTTHQTTAGLGLTLHASYAVLVRKPVSLGVVVEQHLGAPHSAGPYPSNGGSTFPEIHVSPIYTTFGIELASRQP